MPWVGERQGAHGGFEPSMPEGALEAAAGDTGCEQRGGVRMSEGMDGPAGFGDPGTACGLTAGALDAVATHGRRSGGPVLLIAAGGGQEPGGVWGGCPVGPQP
jgi:hypothetical protein